MEDEEIRVLIVDDHDILRYGVKMLLGRHPPIRVVGEAESVTAALEAVATLAPDVVLMDARLPNGSGIDACREILSTSPSVRVLIFSAYSDEETVMMALLAGAAGHVSKDLQVEGLVQAIRTVAGGGTLSPPRARENMLAVIAESAAAPAEANPLERLSPQEERIMTLVVDGKTNKEIAIAMGLSDKTVKNYLRNAFQKMGVGRRAHAASLFVTRRT